MTGAAPPQPDLARLVEHLARLRSVSLAPEWTHGDNGGLPAAEASVEDVEDLVREAGWKPLQRVPGRPRASQFPLLIHDPDEGWAVAERWRSTQQVETGGAGSMDNRTIGPSTSFFDLRLPGTRLERRKRAMRVVTGALMRRKSTFGSAFLATLVVNVIALATSLYSMQVYDRVIPRGGFATLWVLTVGVLAALLFDFVLRTLRALMMEREAAEVDSELSEYFFARAEASRLDARPAGIGTLAAQVRGVEQIRSLLSAAFVFLIADLPFALLFLLVIGALGGKLVLVPLIALPLTLGLALLFARMIRWDTARAQASGNRKNGLLVETFDAAEIVKASNASPLLIQRWSRLMDELELYELPVKRWSSIAGSVFNLIQQVTYILVVAWGAVLIAERHLTMGGLIACTILVGRVTAPLIAQFPNFLVQWGYARSSLQSLDTILALPMDNRLGADSLRPERLEPSLRCENLAYGYPGSGPGISIARLDIAAGERIAIIGATGSGKSTLLRLLSGLYAPAEGRVRLGGLEIGQIAPDVLRRTVGYLPQDARLLNGSLRDNLLLGLRDPGDDALLAAVEECGLAPLIANHPRGLDLPIAEGGRGLSGGQKALANLARLFLADPDLLLLDEPTSNLDPTAENRIVESLRRRADSGKTMILVTHRIQLLALAARVIVLHEGRIVEDGPTGVILDRLKAAPARAAATAAQDRA